MADVGEPAPGDTDGRDRDRIVERRQRAESVDRGHRCIVEDHRGAERVAAMNDPMPDTPDGRCLASHSVEGTLERAFHILLARAGDRPRLGHGRPRRVCPGLDQAGLERARARVEDKRGQSAPPEPDQVQSVISAGSSPYVSA